MDLKIAITVVVFVILITSIIQFSLPSTSDRNIFQYRITEPRNVNRDEWTFVPVPELDDRASDFVIIGRVANGYKFEVIRINYVGGRQIVTATPLPRNVPVEDLDESTALFLIN